MTGNKKITLRLTRVNDALSGLGDRLVLEHARRALQTSDSYLSFTVRDQIVSGQWDITLRDLDYAIGLLDGFAQDKLR